MSDLPHTITRVEQTKTGGEGNCWQACIAMLIGRTIDRVPALAAGTDNMSTMIARTSKWLQASGHGLVLLDWHGGRDRPGMPWINGPRIESGPGPRGLNHAIVIDHYGRKFDPHPDQTGLLASHDVAFIVSLPNRYGQRIDGLKASKNS